MDEFENTTAVSAMIAAQQENVRDTGRFMTLTKFDFPFRPTNTTFHSAARVMYGVIPFEDVYLPTAKQWSHKQTHKTTAKLVRHCRNVERVFGIISKSISTYERPWTSDNFPMAVLTVTRVPKRDSTETACLIIRLTHAMTGLEDEDLKFQNKDGDLVWKKGAEARVAQREAQRNPEFIIHALVNATHYREFKEMRSSGYQAKNGVNMEVQKAYRRENFHKFLNIEQYREMCAWYCENVHHPDEWQSCGLSSQGSPLNPFNVFTLDRACLLAERYGADRAYCHPMSWETSAGNANGVRQFTSPCNGATTFRLLLKEFGPDDLPGFLFPWEVRPTPLETDKMFLHLRKRFGYDVAQTEQERKEATKQAQEAMQYHCMQQETGVRNNLFALKDRIESELDSELRKVAGNVLDEQRLRKQLSEKHTQEYLRIFQRNGDIPKALRAIAVWLDEFLASRKSPSLPVKKWTRNLTWAQEQRASMLSCLESLSQVYTNHREIVLCQYAARHVYWRTDLHPNIYCYGDFSVGKSFMYTFLGKLAIPGTTKQYTSSTPRADFQETSDEFDMTVEINEEANPRLFCSDMKHAGMSAGHGGGSTMDDSGQNTEAAAFRQRLTSGKISWKACGIVDGIRFRQDCSIPANVMFFVAANWRKERVPANMMSRFIALPAHAKERKEGTLLQKMVASKRQLPGDKESRDFYFERYRRNQAFTAFIAVGMWLRILHPTTTVVSDNVFLAALDRSRTAGMTGTNDIRRFEFLRYLVDTVCVDDAVNFLLDSPLSPIMGQQWNWDKHFKLFNPLLRTETEQAVFVLELMGGYEDPMEYHIYKALNAALKTEYSDDKSGTVEEIKGSGQAGGQSSIRSWVNSGAGAGHVPMHDDAPIPPYIERKEGAGNAPPFESANARAAATAAAMDAKGEDRMLTPEEVDHKNYIIVPWQEREANNRYYNDWNRCEVLWKQIYDHIVGVRCAHDEGMHFLFSRLSQKVPCCVQEGLTIPAMTFSGNKLKISRAVLSGNTQFRLRDSLITILSKPHMRRMTYLMGQTDPMFPFVWFTKDMRMSHNIAGDADKAEPLKLFNLNYINPLDKQIIANMCAEQGAGRFKSWAEGAMEDLLQQAKFDKLDADIEEYAHVLRMLELNWSADDVRLLLAPCQDAKDPTAKPYLIPRERDAKIRRLASDAVKAKQQAPLVIYPECYYSQEQDDKKHQDAEHGESLKRRTQKLLEIQETSVKKALEDWKARGVDMDQQRDEPPPLENAENLPDIGGMDLGRDRKEYKVEDILRTPVRRTADGLRYSQEAHPELDDTAMFDDTSDNSRGVPAAMETKDNQPGDETDFSSFFRQELKLGRQQSQPQPQPVPQEQQQQSQPSRPFGFIRQLRRFSDAPAPSTPPNSNGSSSSSSAYAHQREGVDDMDL